MLGVRARARQGRPFRAPPAMTRSRARVFFFGLVGAEPASALEAPAWTAAQATDHDLKSD